MSNKRMRYTEDFKKSIVALYHDGQTQLRLSEDYGVAPSTILNGLSSIQKSKQIMERFLLLNKLVNSRNKLPYSKKRTSS